jgi:hypothetical protein
MSLNLKIMTGEKVLHPALRIINQAVVDRVSPQLDGIVERNPYGSFRAY